MSSTMPTKPSVLPRARGRRRLPLIVWGVMACLIGVNEAAAAGCHYGTHHDSQELAERRGELVTSWDWWAGGQVRVIYAGGQFSYLRMVDVPLPCDRPECRGSSPETSVEPVATTSNTQRTLTSLASHSGISLNGGTSRDYQRLCDQPLPQVPFLGHLLKPPR